MIESLQIRNFALVEELTLELGPGLNVLTGETGAGKSILLQALGLLLGDRASRDSVRAGAAQARVQGEFQPAEAAAGRLRVLLEEAGVPWEDGDPLLLARTVAADGRSRAFVNGSTVSTGLLTRLGAHLVEFSGQHQHQGLLREETHLGLLDRALPAAGRAVLLDYSGELAKWLTARDTVARLQRLETEGRERAEFLRFQCEEIRAAGLQPGEDRTLRAERDLLAHAGKLLEGYAEAEAELYSGTDAALDRVGRALRTVERAAERDPAAAPIREVLEEARSGLEEAALQLRQRRDRLEADPRRLEAVEGRIDQLRRLERKYGAGVEAILGRLEAMEAELWELENTELALDQARKTLTSAAVVLQRAAAELCRVRRATAAELEQRVGRELEALALGRSAFRVEWLPVEPGPDGTETARFLLAPNPGEPAKPLARTASGGELSRILLGLKNALRDAGVETLVFDEVDAGVGGATAEAVGERLSELARGCQVVVITHLPQIAPRAARHLRVDKQVADGRTVIRVVALGAEERVAELARMLAGNEISPTVLGHARELAARYAT
ncbi:MAG: DNA repair protein RecN [Deferrisomatales bacterium]|nr:DNA repair protein RecN [Deferrisomatales bacterium]